MIKTAQIMYHEVALDVPCPDGWAGAWVAQRALEREGYQTIILSGCSYSKPLPAIVPGADLFLIDFSVESPEENEAIRAQVNSLHIIDHHADRMKALLGHASLEDLILFDKDRCGALLAWQFFHGDAPPPAFLLYVDDRDRWQHRLPMTHEIHASYSELGRTFAVYDALSKLGQEDLIGLLEKVGASSLARRDKKVQEIADRFFIWDSVAGYRYVPVVELQPGEGWTSSQVGELLYRKYPEAPFAATVEFKDSGTKWSLRSNEYGNNTDVCAIAKLQPIAPGAQPRGGHRNAAGFTLPPGELPEGFLKHPNYVGRMEP